MHNQNIEAYIKGGTTNFMLLKKSPLNTLDNIFEETSFKTNII